MILPILGALCLLGAVYFLLPLAMGVCHIGMFWPAAILLILAVVFFFPRLWEKRADSFKVVVLTLFSGILPSRSAAKKDPVLALRTE